MTQKEMFGWMVCAALMSSGFVFGKVKINDEVVVEGHLRRSQADFTMTDVPGPTKGSGTCTPNTDIVHVNCLDSSGCEITIGETSALDGDITYFHCHGYDTTFTDTAGVTELSGNFTCKENDSITLMYANNTLDTWIQISESNN